MNTNRLKRAIYQDGQTTMQTCTYLDEAGTERASCTFEMERGEAITGNKRAADYLEELNENRAEGSPPFRLIDLEEACSMIEEEQVKAYESDWQEVDSEYWQEHLEVLPPEKWRTVRGVEIFRICERTAGNITQHLAKLDDRYFARSCRTTIPYEDLAAQVAQL